MYTSDKDDKSLLSRAEDTVRLSKLRHKPCFLGFLNEREQFILNDYFAGRGLNISYFGGYENAQRKILGSYDDDLLPDDYPVEKVCFGFKRFDKLGHRDFLGALMGLGIERDCIGDIIVGDESAICFVKSEIADYIRSQIFKIGRAGVKLISESECDVSFEQQFDELVFTVSSMRLDVIVAAITGLSRDKTASLITSGKVMVNYSESKNVSHFLRQDDILTIRGKGKYIIKGQSGLTKKGRLKINIEHYR